MSNPKIIKSYKAGATVNKYRIVKGGADDDHVIQAAAATDKLIGVLDVAGIAGTTQAAEERVDVIHAGIAECEAGGTIAVGDPITSDANGKAVAAAPTAGTNNPIVGKALRSAVSGDIFPVLVSLGTVQG